MPIYRANGNRYNIPDDKIQDFERRYPESKVEMYDGEGKKYAIPLSKRNKFQQRYEKWSYVTEETKKESPDPSGSNQNPPNIIVSEDELENSIANYEESLGHGKYGAGNTPLFQKVRQAATSAEQIADGIIDKNWISQSPSSSARDSEIGEVSVGRRGSTSTRTPVSDAYKSQFDKPLEDRFADARTRLEKDVVFQFENMLNKIEEDINENSEWRNEAEQIENEGDIFKNYKGYKNITEDTIEDLEREGYVPKEMGEILKRRSVQNLTRKYISEARDVIEMYKRKDGNGLANFADAFARSFDSGILTLGATDAIDMGRVLSIANKIGDKGEGFEKLTKEEQQIMAAFSLLDQIQGSLQLDTWQNIGRGTMESLPYLVEFALTGGVGAAASAATKAAAKTAVKKIIGKSASKAVSRIAANAGKNAAGRVAMNAAGKIGNAAVDGLVGGTVMALTSGAGRTAEDVMSRMVGDHDIRLGSINDPSGELKTIYTHHGVEDRESLGLAFLKGFAANLIENGTEYMGNYMGLNLGKLLSRYKGGRQLLTKPLIGKTTRFARQVGKLTGFNGFIPEVAEEELGMLLNAATVGDVEWEDIKDPEQQFQTVMAVGIMSLGFQVANSIGVGLTYNRYRKAKKRYESKDLGEGLSVDDIIHGLDNVPLDRRADYVMATVNTHDLGKEDAKDLQDFVMARTGYEFILGKIESDAEEAGDKAAEAEMRLINKEMGGKVTVTLLDGREAILTVGNVSLEPNAAGEYTTATQSGSLIAVPVGVGNTPIMVSPKDIRSVSIMSTEDAVGQARAMAEDITKTNMASRIENEADEVESDEQSRTPSSTSVSQSDIAQSSSPASGSEIGEVAQPEGLNPEGRGGYNEREVSPRDGGLYRKSELEIGDVVTFNDYSDPENPGVERTLKIIGIDDSGVDVEDVVDGVPLPLSIKPEQITHVKGKEKKQTTGGDEIRLWDYITYLDDETGKQKQGRVIEISPEGEISVQVRDEELNYPYTKYISPENIIGKYEPQEQTGNTAEQRTPSSPVSPQGNIGEVEQPEVLNPERQTAPQSEITDTSEYTRFVEDGTVEDSTVLRIANKIANGEQLTREEEAMRQEVSQRVEDKLREIQQNVEGKEETDRWAKYRKSNGEVDEKKMPLREQFEYGEEIAGVKAMIEVAKAGTKNTQSEVARLEKEIEREISPVKRVNKEKQLKSLNERLGTYQQYLEDNNSDLQSLKATPANIVDRIAALGDIKSLRDYILRLVATGNIKFKWGDTDSSKGLASHLGINDSPSERRKRISLLSNSGYTPEQLAHNIWEQQDVQNSDLPFKGYETDEILDEILDVMSSVYSPSQALELAEQIANEDLRKQEMASQDYESHELEQSSIEQIELEPLPDDLAPRNDIAFRRNELGETQSGQTQINERESNSNKENSLSSQEEKQIDSQDEILQSIPQRERGTEAQRDRRMEETALRLQDRIEEAARDAQAAGRTLSRAEQQEIEARAAEEYAKENGIWIPMEETFSWNPMPSGNENDVYLNTLDGYVYKVNNLMNSKGILPLFDRIKLHNQIFPSSRYEFVGFTGFDGRSVYPIFRQVYVHESTNATPEEIDTYMKSLGFHQTGEAQYSNGEITISDLRPRNVLKSNSGNIYVVDAEFKQEGQSDKETVDKTEPQQPDNTVSTGSPISEKENPASTKTTDTDTTSLRGGTALSQAGFSAGKDNTSASNEQEKPRLSTQKTLQERRQEIQEYIEREAGKLNIPVRIVGDVSQISPSEKNYTKKLKSQGWYDQTTGEIVIVAPNHGSIRDAQRTLLHEAVAHYGLSAMLGRENFDKLCDQVWDSMTDRERAYFGAYTEGKKYGDLTNEEKEQYTANDFSGKRAAADEYLAHFAEEGITTPSLWSKIKRFVKEAFRKIGIDLSLTDSDIAYLLWKSKNRITDKDSMTDIIRKSAADTRIKEGIEERFRTVYHGSGASFDRFDHSFMGTGEGAQAYGWGTYVTEVNGIAKSYAEKAADPAKKDYLYEEIAKLKDIIRYEPDLYIDNMSTLSDLKKQIKELEEIQRNDPDFDFEIPRLKEYEKEWERLEDLISKVSTRVLYTVEIPDDTGENYLDWDKPVTKEQIKRIQDYLSENYRKYKLNEFNASIAPSTAVNAEEIDKWTMRGENIYKTLENLLGGDREASEALWQCGFTGISYPSQNTTGGRSDGARNYVIFNENDLQITDHTRFRMGEAYTSEEQDIIERARENGTYLKTPNGADTNLTTKQWAQVRTRAFKEWFGDWEKAARIEKLRNSEPVTVSGSEYQGKYELSSKSAEDYIVNSLRGEYTNKDTGNIVNITRASRKVAHHDAENDIHLKSIAYIPQMIENAIFIDESPNEKGTKFDSYRYYVVGLNIDGVDYTAKLVIGHKNGESYYDHSLTEIKKNNLLNLTDGVKADVSDKEAALSTVKDKRLLSLLQVNSSKVVDENGEPKVVFHGTPLRRDQITPNRGWQKDGITYISQEAPFYAFRGGEYSGMIFTSVDPEKARSIAEKRAMSIPDDMDGTEQWTEEGYVYDLFVDVKKPFVPQRDADIVLSSLGDEIPTLSFYGGQGDTVSVETAKEILNSGNSWLVTETPQFVAEIKKLGYDGLTGTDEGVDYIACFNPNQLKDAYDNTGTFSTENDDIRFRTIVVNPRYGSKIETVRTNHTSVYKAVDKYLRENFDEKDYTTHTAKTGSRYLELNIGGDTLKVRFANHTPRMEASDNMDTIGNGKEIAFFPGGDMEVEIDISLSGDRSKEIIDLIKGMKEYSSSEVKKEVSRLIDGAKTDPFPDVASPQLIEELSRYIGTEMAGTLDTQIAEYYKYRVNENVYKQESKSRDSKLKQNKYVLEQYKTIFRDFVQESPKLIKAVGGGYWYNGATGSIRIVPPFPIDYGMLSNKLMSSHFIPLSGINKKEGKRQIVQEYVDEWSRRLTDSGIFLSEEYVSEGAKITEAQQEIDNIREQYNFWVKAKLNTEANAADTDTRYRTTEYMEAVNQRFNEQLSELTEENADRIIMSLGRPSEILRSVDIPDRDIRLYGNKVMKKSKSHGYSTLDLKDLPKMLQHPIAIFKGSYPGSFSLLTEIELKGNNALVSIDIKKGEVQDINLVTSVYGKKGDNVLSWIEEGKMLYTDKKKTLDYISSSAPIADATYNQGGNKALDYLYYPAPIAETPSSQELSTATNIVENFENPKLTGENSDGTMNTRFRREAPDVSSYIKISMDGNGIIDLSAFPAEQADRIRKLAEIPYGAKISGDIASFPDYQSAEDCLIYIFNNNDIISDDISNAKANNSILSDITGILDRKIKWGGARRVWVDEYQPLKAFQNLIEKKTGISINNREDAWDYTGQMEAVSASRLEEYKRNYYIPLLESYSQAANTDGIGEEMLLDYIRIKSGIERNARMRREALERWDKENEGKNMEPNSRENYIAYLSTQDYSGYYEHFKEVYAGKYNAPQDFVDYIESVMGNKKTLDLWQKINNATHRILDISVHSGLLSKESADEYKSRDKFYVPLRGFEGETMDEAYNSNVRPSSRSVAAKKAEGRTSMADNPIAYIFNIAATEIDRSGKNIMKRKLLELLSRGIVKNHFCDYYWVKYKDGHTEKLFKKPKENKKIEEIIPVKGVYSIRQKYERAKVDENGNLILDREMNPIWEETDEIPTAEELEKGLARISRARKPAKSPIHKTRAQLLESTVDVYVSGECVSIEFTNPIIANSLNGTLNIDGISFEGMARLNRYMSRSVTSWNPGFVLVNNAIRDLGTASANTAIEHGIIESARANSRALHSIAALRRVILKREKIGTYTDKEISDFLIRMKSGKKMTKEDYNISAYLFIANGGETGYIGEQNIDEYRKFISDAVKYKNTDSKKQGGIPKKLWKSLAKFVENTGRITEDITRLNQFIMAIREGDSMDKSISRAKNVSTNFNRRGSHEGVQWLFDSVMFLNAALQGIDRQWQIAKKHPWKTLGLAVTFPMVVGFVTAWIASVWGSDDDDRWGDSYHQLSSFKRYNNFVFPKMIKGGFITIPLPQIFRAFHAWGVMIYDSLFYNPAHPLITEPITALDFALALGQDVVPFTYGSWTNIGFSFTQPAQHAIFNESFTGAPLYKESLWNENVPEWRKAYGNTSDVFVNLSKWINEMTGGNYAEKGWLEQIPVLEKLNNPAILQQLYLGYSPGLFRVLGQAYNAVDALVKKTKGRPTDFDLSDVPIIGAVVGEANDRIPKSKLRSKWYEFANKARDSKRADSELLKELFIDEFIENTRDSDKVLSKSVYDGLNVHIRNLMKLEGMAETWEDDLVSGDLPADEAIRTSAEIASLRNTIDNTLYDIINELKIAQ